ILSMSFHITCYILIGHRFGFLASLRLPFTKFCINNSLIPIFFTIIYVYNLIQYQNKYGYGELWTKLLGLVIGLATMLVVFLIYFHYTNKDIFKHLAENVDKRLKRNKINRFLVMQRLANTQTNRIIVKSYFQLPFSLKRIRYDYTYNREDILKIFDQNQLNALVIQAVSFAFLVLLGIFRDVEYMQIPAAASGMILISVLMMLTGAITYWFRGWSGFVVVIIVLILNTSLLRVGKQKPYNQAFGLDYDKKAEYSLERIQALSNEEDFLADFRATTQILENWKNKFSDGKDTTAKKPKMIFICSSGGGQRASVWTMRCLQVLDSAFDGQIMKNTMLMTGASGGMIGAAYFRELYLQKQKQKAINLNEKNYLDNIAKDRLNPLIFALLTGDLGFKFQQVSYGQKSYFKDRSYFFERKIIKDTENVLDKRVIDYYLPEYKAQIPMMIVSPCIINDGRKLFISSQDISYMTSDEALEQKYISTKIKGIEFRRFFKEQDADSLHFVTALRMNATFPYITPNVLLPSAPLMEVMDAGLLDNFGLDNAIRFLYVFRDWISEHTSGVIFISIRDSQKEIEPKHNERTFLNYLFSPLEDVIGNMTRIQSIRNENDLEYAKSWFMGNINLIELQYQEGLIATEKNSNNLPPSAQPASLSWRLTAKEKEGINQMIYCDFNKASMEKLRQLLYE
ncbi:MAG: patatin-like phospholipase family protein, partial [Thermoflexibacter sp.]|nr:patatin-like phospholipase family protein [Thermoflexibacter sp.]